MSDLSIIFSTLSQESFLIINKSILRALGANKTLVLSNLIDKARCLRMNGGDDDGWFYLTNKQQEEQVGLEEETITRIHKKLEKLELIRTKYQGMPRKKYYKLNAGKILELVQGDQGGASTPEIRGASTPEIRGASTPKSRGASTPKSRGATLYNKKRVNKNKKDSPRTLSRSGLSTTEGVGRSRKPKLPTPSEYEKASSNFYDNIISNGFRKKIPSTAIKKGAAELERLSRLDGYDLEEEIVPALEWALEDEFWCRQILSLNTIRTRSPNGNIKFTNMYNQYISQAKTKPKPKGNRKLNKQTRPSERKISYEWE